MSDTCFLAGKERNPGSEKMIQKTINGNLMAAATILTFACRLLQNIPLCDIFFGLSKGEIIIICLISAITILWCISQIATFLAAAVSDVVEYLWNNRQRIKEKIKQLHIQNEPKERQPEHFEPPTSGDDKEKTKE